MGTLPTCLAHHTSHIIPASPPAPFQLISTECQNSDTSCSLIMQSRLIANVHSSPHLLGSRISAGREGLERRVSSGAQTCGNSSVEANTHVSNQKMSASPCYSPPPFCRQAKVSETGQQPPSDALQLSFLLTILIGYVVIKLTCLVPGSPFRGIAAKLG